MKAVTRTSSIAQWVSVPPGRMMIIAPAKPTATAAQRRGPTASPSMGAASAVTISGPVKLIALAVGTGIQRSAVKKQTVETNISSERTMCTPGRVARSRPRPWRGMNIATMNTRCPV